MNFELHADFNDFKSLLRYHNDFEELEKIGRGGFGQVWRVRNRLDGCEYAIKKIPLDKARSEKSIDKILREVQTISRLNHHNIVRYYFSWIEADRPRPDDDDSDAEESDVEESSEEDVHKEEEEDSHVDALLALEEQTLLSRSLPLLPDAENDSFFEISPVKKLSFASARDRRRRRCEYSEESGSEEDDMFGSEIFWMNPAATSVFEEVNLTSETQEPQQKKGTAAPPKRQHFGPNVSFQEEGEENCQKQNHFLQGRNNSFQKNTKEKPLKANSASTLLFEKEPVPKDDEKVENPFLKSSKSFFADRQPSFFPAATMENSPFLFRSFSQAQFQQKCNESELIKIEANSTILLAALEPPPPSSPREQPQEIPKVVHFQKELPEKQTIKLKEASPPRSAPLQASRFSNFCRAWDDSSSDEEVLDPQVDDRVTSPSAYEHLSRSVPLSSSNYRFFCPQELEESEKLVHYLYLQMEQCVCSLRQLLEDHTFWVGKTECDIWACFKQIVDGLSHVHSKGIIHRDLNPSNIFITADSVYKIGDFGLAAITDESRSGSLTLSEPPSPLTSSPSDILSSPCVGEVSGDLLTSGCALSSDVGTSLYCAPEILQGSSCPIEYGDKVDIFCLGVILFEMWYPFNTEMERCHVLEQLQNSYVFPADFGQGGKFPCSDVQVLQALIRSLVQLSSAERPSIEVVAAGANKVLKMVEEREAKNSPSLNPPSSNLSGSSPSCDCFKNSGLMNHLTCENLELKKHLREQDAELKAMRRKLKKLKRANQQLEKTNRKQKDELSHYRKRDKTSEPNEQ